MGLLDNKERIFDTIITREGRRQIASGDLKAKYVAFSDRFTFYQGDINSGSAPADLRVFFESYSLPQDRISFEADDSGRLLSLESEANLKLFGGKIVSSSNGLERFITGSDAFVSLAGTLLSGSLQNFDKMRILGSEDRFGDDTEFNISDNRIEFSFDENRPIPLSGIQFASVDSIDSFFQDKRLSHIKNFKFLPPKNAPTLQFPEGSSLGKFIPIHQDPILTFGELQKQLEKLEKHTISFKDTSRANNIFSQFFEIGPNDMRKLDVIDFGSFLTEDGDVHVFFVGKVYLDRLKRHTFVNLFTIVFGEEDVIDAVSFGKIVPQRRLEKRR